jgi:hypothetical protein
MDVIAVSRNPYDPSEIQSRIKSKIIKPRNLFVILFARGVLCLTSQVVSKRLIASEENIGLWSGWASTAASSVSSAWVLRMGH